MKKTKRIALSITICMSLLLTGCNNALPTASEGGASLKPANSSAYIADDKAVRKSFAEIRESFESDVEAIKSKEYDNLNFDKAIFSPPPQIDSISELKLVELTGKSTDEIYAFFSEAVNKLTNKKYTDEEKKYKIRFADAKPDENQQYPYKFPNIDEYKNGNETDYPRLFLDDENYYISMITGVIRGFDNGDLLDYDGVDRTSTNMGLYNMISNDKHHNVFYTEDLTCTDIYRLVDGEISIADAARFTQNYLDELIYTPYVDANLPNPVIYAVNVFDIGNGCYGYSFLITVEYNSVFFDHHEQKAGGMGMVGVGTDYDERRYNSWIGRAEMIRTDKIHRFVDIARGYDVTDGEQASEIITISSAADIVSEFFSGFMNFTVTEVSMVWVQTAEIDNPEQEAYPCWKFKMSTDGEIYHTFVDVITGEIHLYVQVV